MSKNQKYTQGQKRAYYSGQGYRAAYEGKAIPFKSEKNKRSLRKYILLEKISCSFRS